MSTQQPASPIDATDLPSGAVAGQVTGKSMPEGRRFSGDYAREMGRRGAQKRHGQMVGRHDHDMVLIPAESEAVFIALREQAKTGSPQAVREYRDWLRERGTTRPDELDYAVTPIEEMTPDQRAFALVLIERHTARAQGKYTGTYRAELLARARDAAAKIVQADTDPQNVGPEGR